MAAAKNNVSLGLKVALVISVLCVLSKVGLSLDLYPKTMHVVVMNSLGPSNVLSFHCKSGDDDLGQHDLAFNKSYEWTFRMQAFDRTLFWCTAWWYDHGKLVSQKFDIFDGTDIDRTCGTSHKVCHRKFQFDGIYFENANGAYTKTLDWSRP